MAAAQASVPGATLADAQQHIASNFVVEFESDTMAHARYTCFATHGSHEWDLSKHFMEAGYYYSSFRREPTADGFSTWKFSHLTLDMVWTQGEALGLNEPLVGVFTGESSRL
jgi:hypothetical protein